MVQQLCAEQWGLCQASKTEKQGFLKQEQDIQFKRNHIDNNEPR